MALLDGIIHHDHNHVVMVNIGIADPLAPENRDPRESLRPTSPRAASCMMQSALAPQALQ